MGVYLNTGFHGNFIQKIQVEPRKIFRFLLHFRFLRITMALMWSLVLVLFSFALLCKTRVHGFVFTPSLPSISIVDKFSFPVSILFLRRLVAEIFDKQLPLVPVEVSFGG